MRMGVFITRDRGRLEFLTVQLCDFERIIFERCCLLYHHGKKGHREKWTNAKIHETPVGCIAFVRFNESIRFGVPRMEPFRFTPSMAAKFFFRWRSL